MKLKPFNLEEALNGAKVVTRDGREVKQLTFFETKSPFPLIGVCDNGFMSSWQKNGINNTESSISENDLFIAVETQSVWANVYVDDNRLWIGEAYPSKEEAIKNIYKHSNCIKTIEITDEI